ncbi:hypothetical protein D9Q98_003526 [Chlorella vulgaris]|uniref:MYND-type domain-containing protein n=1 Tax=Chlorella vulgaris TaxID=3077 RepID=A0A9D4TTB4_CHLVU|nr:hypothetical protein D9Q98_003526 [Chlorella vulgaris]
MPPAPARVILTLVKEVCDMDSSSVDEEDLRLRVRNLPSLCHGITSDAETRAAVDSVLQESGKRLGALGARLAALFARGRVTGGALSQYTLACLTSEFLCHVALEFQLVGAANALLGCITLPLECGRILSPLLPGLNIPGQRGRDERYDSETSGIDIMKFQTLLMSKMFDLSVAPFVDADEFFAGVAAPEPLLAWLSAATSAVLSLDGPLFGRVSSQAQLALFAIVIDVVNGPIFKPHAAVLASNSSLQRSLSQLLVPALHPMAVAMQLPADRRPADFNWIMVSSVVNVLSADELYKAVEEQVATASGSAVSNSAPRVLQSLVQLFVAAPASCPSDMEVGMHAQLWFYLFKLLGSTASMLTPTVYGQQQGSTAMTAMQRQHTLQQMLRALPRLPTALTVVFKASQHQAVEQDVQFHWLKTPAGLMMGCCFNVLALLEQLSRGDTIPSAAAAVLGQSSSLPQYPTLAGLHEVPAMCAASGALLRALPLAAQFLADLERREVGEEEADVASEALRSEALELLPEMLMGEACGMMSAVHHFCCLTEGRTWSAADCASAGQSLWQVHTTLCRCVNCLAATGLPHTLFAKLLIGLNLVHLSAVAVSAALRALADGDESRAGEESNSTPMHLLAMNVAQTEAALVATTSCDLALPQQVLGTVLIRAVEGGPPALASSPAFRQALGHMAEQLGVDGANNPAAASWLAALQGREAQPGDELELAQAATARSCAYLRCANLAGEGGPAAREGAGSQRCSKCKAAWYCGTACSHADWRAGHRRVCKALAAARVAERQEQQGAAA